MAAPIKSGKVRATMRTCAIDYVLRALRSVSTFSRMLDEIGIQDFSFVGAALVPAHSAPGGDELCHYRAAV